MIKILLPLLISINAQALDISILQAGANWVLEVELCGELKIIKVPEPKTKQEQDYLVKYVALKFAKACKTDKTAR